MSLFYGFSGGVATPIRLGEYVGRKIPFENTGIMKVTIATLVEKFASLIIVLIIGAFAASIFIIKYFSISYAIPLILFIIIFCWLIILFLKGYHLTSKWINNLGERFKFVENLITEFTYIRQLGKRTVTRLFTISFIFYGVIIFQYGLLTLAFNTKGNIIHYLIAGIIVMFVKSLFSFISFADLGVRESTSVFVLHKMGYAKAIGFNAAIFLFLFNVLVPSLVGLILLLKKDK